MNLLDQTKFTPSGYKIDARVTTDEKGNRCFAFFPSPAFKGTVEQAEADARLYQNAPKVYGILKKAQEFVHAMRCVKEGTPDRNMKLHEVADVIQLDDEMIKAMMEIVDGK